MDAAQIRKALKLLQW